MNPVTEAAHPEYEFSIDTTTGMSAPPIDATRWIPNRNEIKSIGLKPGEKNYDDLLIYGYKIKT